MYFGLTGHQWSGESDEWGWGTGGISLRNQNVSNLWLGVEEETTASNY